MPLTVAAKLSCSCCSDSDGEEEASGSDDEAAAAVEFEVATAGQGRKAGGGRGSRKQAAALPKAGVSGAWRVAAAGGTGGGKAAAAVPQGGSAAAAAPARRHAADPGLQSPTGKRRPGESGSQRNMCGKCSMWAFTGFFRHPAHTQCLRHLQRLSDTTSHTSCHELHFTPLCTASTQARRSRGAQP
jgi:hypothetical protein